MHAQLNQKLSLLEQMHACTVESEAGPLVIDPVVSAVKSSLGTDLVESAALLLVTDPDGV